MNTSHDRRRPREAGACAEWCDDGAVRSRQHAYAAAWPEHRQVEEAPGEPATLPSLTPHESVNE